MIWYFYMARHELTKNVKHCIFDRNFLALEYGRLQPDHQTVKIWEQLWVLIAAMIQEKQIELSK